MTTTERPVTATSTKTQFVYRFGDGKADGSADMRNLLGGKGAGLAEMTNLGVPVPPGFTITTDVCTAFYELDRSYPDGLEQQVHDGVEYVESLLGRRFGDPDRPLQPPAVPRCGHLGYAVG
jgi:pyruvate,orthophosphate dikinase